MTDDTWGLFTRSRSKPHDCSTPLAVKVFLKGKGLTTNPKSLAQLLSLVVVRRDMKCSGNHPKHLAVVTQY